jgi:hypothetical protein
LHLLGALMVKKKWKTQHYPEQLKAHTSTQQARKAYEPSAIRLAVLKQSVELLSFWREGF